MLFRKNVPFYWISQFFFWFVPDKYFTITWNWNQADLLAYVHIFWINFYPTNRLNWLPMEIFISFGFNYDFFILIFLIWFPNIDLTINCAICKNLLFRGMEIDTSDTVRNFDSQVRFFGIEISSKDMPNTDNTLMFTPGGMVWFTVSNGKWSSIARPWNSRNLVAIFYWIDFTWHFIRILIDNLVLLILFRLLSFIHIAIEISIEFIIFIITIFISFFHFFQSFLCCFICFTEIKIRLKPMCHFNLVIGFILPLDIIIVKNMTLRICFEIIFKFRFNSL